MKKITVFLWVFVSAFQNFAQQDNNGEFHGNFQSNIMTYTEDSAIGAGKVAEKVLTNTYANLNYTKGNFTAGLRFEANLNPLEGYDKRNNGTGISYKYITYQNEGFEFTAGNFYEQFGNGLVLRSYEDKNIDYDNAIDGFRIKFTPVNGFILKGIYGRERNYFTNDKGFGKLINGEGIVRGMDGEIFLNDMFENFQSLPFQVTLGGSIVSKYQPENDPTYKIPENVAAFAGRLNLNIGNFAINSEYAEKINDPSVDNRYIYKKGYGFLLNASYSQSGLGILVSAKRNDNMSFRSERNAQLKSLLINYLPDITKNHAYTLSAMYPYGVQQNGEAGVMAEINYKIKKGSILGGEYGTQIALNFSHMRDIKHDTISGIPLYKSGTLGYKSSFFEIGDEKFYQDFNIEITRKFSSKVKAIVAFVDQFYNASVLKGASNGLDEYHGSLYSDIAIADVSYKINDNHSVRVEMQHLWSKQNTKNWAFGLVEYSIAPKWFFTLIDQYNYGNSDADKKIHYYTAAFAYVQNSTRIQMGYGKQRQGVVCVGGVCRSVPASNGLTISISSTF